MKALKFIVIGVLLSMAIPTQAQISLHLNLGTPPQWGPVGYSQARYYYLPDVEAYYDVQSSMFIYMSGGAWVHRAYLPERYRDYDLYGGYKVVMNGYRGNRPYENFNDYRTRYARGYRGQAQRSIGQRPDRGNDNMRMNGNQNREVNQRSSPNVGRGNMRMESRGNERQVQQNQGRRGGDEKNKKNK
jgi:hypothetical protein